MHFCRLTSPPPVPLPCRSGVACSGAVGLFLGRTRLSAGCWLRGRFAGRLLPSGGCACAGGAWSASPPAEGARHSPPQAVLLGTGHGGVRVLGGPEAPRPARAREAWLNLGLRSGSGRVREVPGGKPTERRAKPVNVCNHKGKVSVF